MASSLPLSLLLLLSLLSLSHQTQSPPSIISPLDPDQITALRSLHLPTKPDPCHNPQNTTQCDHSSPLRHVTALSLLSCPPSLSLSPLSLLPNLTSLSLSSCHVSPLRLPPSLSSNLRSFAAVSSFDRRLTGVWLSRRVNLASLTVVNSAVNASGPTFILYSMRKLQSLTISDSNLTGKIPKHWKSLNLTLIDFSNNGLKGNIPSSISILESLETLNLSNNRLDGAIPTSIGDILGLKNLSLSFNSISGTVPSDLPKGLEYLDLGSNQLNGTIPHFISGMKSLKYLNLEKNNFEGVMPFNASFIKSLEVFKIGGNSNLCYNRSVVSAKIKLGIARCDKHGLPLSPPPPKEGGGGEDDGGDDGDYSSEDDKSGDKNKSNYHGPNKVVLGVAIGLSAVVFLIIFCVLVSKCCR